MGDVLTINRTPGDFVQDTQHLTTLEIGAYQMICDQLVIRGQDSDPPSLPDDDVMLASIARLPLAQWRKIKPRLCGPGDMAVLSIANGRVYQIRVALEIEAARVRMAGQAAKGRKSGEVRRAKADLKRRYLGLSGPHDQRPPHPPRHVDVSPVRTQFEPRSNPTMNPSGTSHESRVMSHEEPTALTTSSAIETPTADDVEYLVDVIAAVAPTMRGVTPAQVGLWLTEFGDAGRIASIIVDKRAYLGNKRAEYLTTVLEEQAAGWALDGEDARRHVSMALRQLLLQSAEVH